MAIVPDDKNWTWVLEKTCPECGFDAPATAYEKVPGLTRDYAARLAGALTKDDATVRPDENTWSALEYAAHVRDVCRIFTYRTDIAARRAATDPQVPGFDATTGVADGLPLFSNWDQDVTAIADNYGAQDPAVVATELVEAAESIARAIESVPAADHELAVRRSDGSGFTVESLAIYFLHDVVHHVHDVRA
ncbi:DinB family protein [Nocardia sp. XZ_19_385]|uniref:DinB family protein n=1 Tax=Nocardia sp. XZ_19_385 TaxID=2769488 RepID=UPI00188E5FCF|nr:DinB family protein [Nocardia sp. XZ_19_385]